MGSNILYLMEGINHKGMRSGLGRCMFAVYFTKLIKLTFTLHGTGLGG